MTLGNNPRASIRIFLVILDCLFPGLQAKTPVFSWFPVTENAFFYDLVLYFSFRLPWNLFSERAEPPGDRSVVFMLSFQRR